MQESDAGRLFCVPYHVAFDGEIDSLRLHPQIHLLRLVDAENLLFVRLAMVELESDRADPTQWLHVFDDNIRNRLPGLRVENGKRVIRIL